MFARLWREDGAGMAVEYAVIAALVSVAALVGYVVFAGAVSELFGFVGSHAGDVLVH